MCCKTMIGGALFLLLSWGQAWADPVIFSSKIASIKDNDRFDVCAEGKTLFSELSDPQITLQIASCIAKDTTHGVGNAIADVTIRPVLGNALAVASFGEMSEASCLHGGCSARGKTYKTTAEKFMVKAIFNGPSNSLITTKTIKLAKYNCWDIAGALGQLDFGLNSSVGVKCNDEGNMMTVQGIYYESTAQQECGLAGTTENRANDCRKLAHSTDVFWAFHDGPEFHWVLVTHQYDPMTEKFEDIWQDEATLKLWRLIDGPYKAAAQINACNTNKPDNSKWRVPTVEESREAQEHGFVYISPGNSFAGKLNKRTKRVLIQALDDTSRKANNIIPYTMDITNNPEKFYFEPAVCVGQ